MSDKYVIKNCPATYQNFEDKFVCTTQIKENGFPFYCQDCTDCVLKQIVDYCLDNEKYGDEYYTDPILKLLDIQEVE